MNPNVVVAEAFAVLSGSYGFRDGDGASGVSQTEARRPPESVIRG